MTIFDLLFCVGISILLGFTVCYLQFVMPLQSSRSRLIGKLNQKEWQIMHWQLAYSKANNDFMKLAEIQQHEAHTQGVIKQEDNGWVDWEYSEDTPHPLTLDTRVDVKFGDGSTFFNDTVDYWYIDSNCWKPNGRMSELIVAYRLTKETHINDC